MAQLARERFQRRQVPILNVRQVLSHLSLEALSWLIFGPQIQGWLLLLHELALPLQQSDAASVPLASIKSLRRCRDVRTAPAPVLAQLRRLITAVAGIGVTRPESERPWLLSVHEACESELVRALDPNAVWDAALGVLLAGRRALADSLTWAICLLAQHPEARRKLAAEVDRVHGGDEVRIDRVHLQVETQHMLAETLRLFPPVPWAVRTTTAPIELGGYRVPSGSTCIVPVQLMQRDPRWHDHPDEFRPARFAGANGESAPRAYHPFAGDPAASLLRQFVMLGGAMVLASLVQRYDWSVVGGFSPPSSAALMNFRWTDGPFIQLHARRRSAVLWSVPNLEG
jgi:cytochrome P450